MVRKQAGQSSKQGEDDNSGGKTGSNKQYILNELHRIYADPKDGLIQLGKKVGLHLFAPRRKVNILLIGNHSSGKSSFINWYIDSKVQKTGVAIETQGFTLVTCGKNRETLAGQATLYLYPYLKQLESIKGVVPYLTTELVPSAARRFELVTLIDTPGLADGELHYPFDIEKAMQWMGESVDLIFVFFDPIGQALCKRTLNLVERLTHSYSERMRFFLSKADEAGDESDRQKVMMQIVQELCKRPGLNQCGFEMSTIFIPNHNDLKVRDKMCVNQIEETCQEIEKTIALTIQNTFNKMDRDIRQLIELTEEKRRLSSKNFAYNLASLGRLVVLILFCLQFPLAALAPQFHDTSIWWRSPLRNKAEFLTSFFDAFIVYLHYIYRLQAILFTHTYIVIGSIAISLAMFWLGKFFLINFKRTLSLKQMNELKTSANRLADHQKRREELFSSYLNSMYDVNLN